jgi:drug/metabolite transporter (DMT)-like permease
VIQVSTEDALATVAAIGAAVGLGKLLESKEPITWRLVVGRAVTSAGLGLASGAAFLFVPSLQTLDPGLQLVMLCGVAAAVSSIGTSLLESIIQRLYNSKL